MRFIFVSNKSQQSSDQNCSSPTILCSYAVYRLRQWKLYRKLSLLRHEICFVGIL